jgi:hypothetical protein
VRWRFIVTMCVHKSADPMDLVYSWTCHAWCMESIARTWHARSSPRNPKAKPPAPCDLSSIYKKSSDRSMRPTKHKFIPQWPPKRNGGRSTCACISRHLGPVRWSSHPVPFL